MNHAITATKTIQELHKICEFTITLVRRCGKDQSLLVPVYNMKNYFYHLNKTTLQFKEYFVNTKIY